MNTLKYIIFDLSEVLIQGLVGTEKTIVLELSVTEFVTEIEVESAFSGNHFEKLMVGQISENEYLSTILKKSRWNITINRLKELIRDNFCTEIANTVPIARNLSEQYPLILLSDHGKEWIEFIESYHSFLKIFSNKFYSYNLGSTKKNHYTFLNVLNELQAKPNECLFIDDNEGNVLRSQTLGIEGIIFKDAKQITAELFKRGICLG